MTRVTTEVKWWWRRVNAERLINWALYLLQGRRYRVELTAQVRTGIHYADRSLIQVNPEALGKEAEAQFTATQGVLAHEVGHALFTDAWPDRKEGALCWLANALEDERIERAMILLYPGIESAVRFAGDLAYAESQAQSETFDEADMLNLCLCWRWAHSRDGHGALLTRFRVPLAFLDTWSVVKQLVEQAWMAPGTREVIRIAQEILKHLGIRETCRLGQLIPFVGGVGSIGDILLSRLHAPLLFPTGAAESGPGLEELEGAPRHGWGYSGHNLSDLAQGDGFIHLEDQARPLANQLIAKLKEPQREQSLAPHAYQGRYTFRQELRTPDTPNLAHTEPGLRSKSLALALALDRSGSMRRFNPQVQLATMVLGLACEGLGKVPLRIYQFGNNGDPPGHDLVVDLAPGAALSDEEKALIAGYRGTTGAEMMAWCLEEAGTWLLGRPEQTKVLIVVHDGCPVYEGEAGNDWAHSEVILYQLQQRCLVLGLCLDASVAEQMQKLFVRLLIGTAEALPETLGAILSNLYV